MSLMNIVETDNVEVLHLMNTSTTDNNGIDPADTSPISVSTTAVPQTGQMFSPHYVCIFLQLTFSYRYA